MVLQLVPGSPCALGSDEEVPALGGDRAALVSDSVALSSSPTRLALKRAVRIRFSHSPCCEIGGCDN